MGIEREEIDILDKILKFEYEQFRMSVSNPSKKVTFIKELGITKERYQYYKNEIGAFRTSTNSPICKADIANDGTAYLIFDESTTVFIEKGGFTEYYKIKKPMPNLDEILSEFMDILASHYPGGIRPKFDFFDNKPYSYLMNTVIEKGTNADLIEWMGAAMKLSTNGYEVIQQNGSYLNYLKSKHKPTPSVIIQHTHIVGDGNTVKPMYHSLDESENNQITKSTVPDKVIKKPIISKIAGKIIIGVVIMIIGTLLLKHFHVI